MHLISEGTKRDENAPGPGLTQRATIDPDTNEIYVLSVSFCLFSAIIALFSKTAPLGLKKKILKTV